MRRKAKQVTLTEIHAAITLLRQELRQVSTRLSIVHELCFITRGSSQHTEELALKVRSIQSALGLRLSGSWNMIHKLNRNELENFVDGLLLPYEKKLELLAVVKSRKGLSLKEKATKICKGLGVEQNNWYGNTRTNKNTVVNVA